MAGPAELTQLVCASQPESGLSASQCCQWDSCVDLRAAAAGWPTLSGEVLTVDSSLLAVTVYHRRQQRHVTVRVVSCCHCKAS